MCNGEAVATRQPNTRLYPSRIDIPEEIRAYLVELLNQTLAETIDLTSQVRYAHWNVRGSDFYQLHQLFDEIAGEIEEYVDDIAERLTALGGVALGTARLAAAASSLPEYPLGAVEGVEHVEALADRFGRYARAVREALGRASDLEDADTADLLTEISRTVDKRLWFLEAHLNVQ